MTVAVILGLPKLISFQSIFSYVLFLTFLKNPFSNTFDLKYLVRTLGSTLQLKQLKKKKCTLTIVYLYMVQMCEQI